MSKKCAKTFEEFFIEYPKNRNPIIHYRNPKTRKYDSSKGRISIVELNKLLKNPRKTISNDVDYIIIAAMGISEEIPGKLFSKEGRKIELPLLRDFVLNYWDYDKSKYLEKERLLKGKEKSPNYCKKQISAYRDHCDPILKNIRIDEFTPSLMEKIQLSMEKEGKAFKTIQRATQTIKIPLEVAYLEGILKEDVSKRIIFRGKFDSKTRGILTQEETERLIKHLKNSTLPNTWKRWRYLTVALGYYTGMREGEIIALKSEDIDTKNNIIDIRHSYQSSEKRLKTPKNGEERYSIAIPPEFINELLEHAKRNEGGFIFPLLKDKSKPLGGGSILKAFKKALEDIGISPKERKERNIVFHSLRHGTGTMLRNGGVSLENTSKGLGHKSLEMTEHYTNHKTEEGKRNLIEATKGKIKYIQ